MRFERLIGIEHIGGPIPLFSLRHLPGKDGVELFHGHSRPRQRPLRAASASSHDGHHHRIEPVVEAGLEQQRDVDHRERRARRFRVGKKLGDPRPDQRMHDGLEPLQTAPDPPTSCSTELLPVDRHHLWRHRGTAASTGADRLAAIELMHASSDENVGTPSSANAFEHRRFARGDRAGEPELDMSS